MIKKIFIMICVVVMLICNTQISVFALERGLSEDDIELDKKNQIIIQDLNTTIIENTGISVNANIIADESVQTAKISVWLSNKKANAKIYDVKLSDNHLDTVINLQDFSFSDGDYNIEIIVETGDIVSKAENVLTYEKRKATIDNFNYTLDEQERYVFKGQVRTDFKIDSIKLLMWDPSEGNAFSKEFNGRIEDGIVTCTIDQSELDFRERKKLSTRLKVVDETGRVVESEIIDIDEQEELQDKQQKVDEKNSSSSTVLKEDQMVLSNSSVKIENVKVTSEGATGYWVEADIKSDYEIVKVQLPTWTAKNGQDDIRWYEAEVTNNHVKYYVNIKNHGYEDGKYITHLYVFDALGGTAGAVAKEVEIKKTPLLIKNATITSTDATGYWVEAELQADYGVKKVQLPTWTAKNGQDDIKWYEVKVTDNRIKYHVDIKNHGYEDGKYITHLYVTDNLGRTASAGLKETEIKKTPLLIKSATVTSTDATGYWVEAKFQADYGIRKVQLPTWTSRNGQDDIQWYEVKVTDNQIKYHVDIKNHGYEDGKYITHLYVTDNLGRTASAGLKETEIKKTPLLIKSATVTSTDATGYWVEAELQADYGVKKVQLPTWTSKNGQDDIQWYEVTVTDNRIKYHVDIKNHGYEDGKYITHLYVTDNLGRTVSAGLNEAEIKKTPFTIKNATIKSKDATGYTIEAEFQSDYGISKVQLPTWTTRNGQDDIQWYETTSNSNRLTYHISIKGHSFESGDYITHLYAYDQAGRSASVALDMVNLPQLNSGFNSIGGSTIYVYNDGTFASGFTDIGNDVYYFDTITKEMITGDRIIDNRRFSFDSTSGIFNNMVADIVYFNQRDARWGYKLYGGATFASTGCVPTVAAMVFSFLNGYVTPDQVGDWAYYYGYLNQPVLGTKATFWSNFSEMKGAYYKGNLSMDEAIKEMKRGRMLVAAMNPGVFAGQGYTHEIVAYGIDKDNMVQVYDPYFPENNGRYHISLIFGQKSTDSEDTLGGGPIFVIG